jgi:alpha-L-rhamnosidase
MAARYDALGHFDTGFLGTDILMEMLCKYGYIDTALKLLESEDLGSYLYMKRHGATTIWENWGGGHSHDHPMFGACVRQFFSALLGIQGDAGYQNLCIRPQIPRNLPWASGSMELPCGKTSVRWEQTDAGVQFCITIPNGCTASFRWQDTEKQLQAGCHTFTV